MQRKRRPARRILKTGAARAYVGRMTGSGFNWVDAVVGVILLAGLIGGVRRGLSGELARVLVATGCIVAVTLYTRPLASWLERRFAHWFGEGTAASMLTSLLLLLLGAYVALTLLRLALTALFSFTFKGRVERVGGALLGLARSAIVAALLLLLLSLLPNNAIHNAATEDSFAGRLVTARVQPWYDRLVEKVPALGGLENSANEWKEDATERAADLWEDLPASDE